MKTMNEMNTLNAMNTLEKIEQLIDAISIYDFNLSFEGFDSDENLEQLIHDPFNSRFIHWLEGFKAGYEKSLIISNNIRDSSYSLTSCQADYNEGYYNSILDHYLKENPEYTRDEMFNDCEYDYYELGEIEWYNADVAFLYFTLYENKKGDIIALLSLNYSFLEGHAHYNDVTLAQVEYSKEVFNNISPETIIRDVDAILS